jgi:hypothetical protein
MADLIALLVALITPDSSSSDPSGGIPNERTGH